MSDLDTMFDQAQELQDLLLSHDKAALQLNFIDCQLTALRQKVFSAAMEGHSGLQLHYLNKLSVAEGVRRAYDNYRLRKWNSIQQLSNQIIQTLRPESSSITEDAPATPTQRTTLDDLAPVVAETFCVFSRSV